MTRLKTLREFSEIMSGSAVRDMPIAKLEWLMTGELRFYKDEEDGLFKRAPRRLQQRWVQHVRGEFIKEEWRDVEMVDDSDRFPF